MKAFLLLVALIAPAFARADTIDRINQCRASGQTSCIFDLLIEMDAKIRDGSGHGHNLLEPGYYRKVSGDCCSTFEVLSHSSSELRLTLCNATFTYRCNRGTNCTVSNGGHNYQIDVTGRNAFRSNSGGNSVCEFVKQ